MKLFKKIFKSSVIAALGALFLVAPVDVPHTALIPGVAQAAANQTAVVTNAQVNLRSGPGTNHGVVGQAVQGNRLPVLSREGDWYRVQRSNGQAAWVAGWLVRVESSPTQQPPTQPSTNVTSQVAVVASAQVNLRSGPGTNHGVVGQAVQGNRLPVLSREGDWLRVQRSNGQAAWIAGWLVRVENNPVQQNPTRPSVPTQPAPGGNNSTVAPGKYVVINTNHVNVRSGPGTNHGIIGMVNTGERYTWLADSGQWHRIKLQNGEGWVANWLTRIQEVAPTTPSRGDDIDRTPTDADQWLPAPPAADNGNNNDQNNNNVPKLTGIDFEVNGNRTVITVEADTALNYNTFMLANPSRLVVNLEGVEMGTLPPIQNINSQTVTRYRSGQFSTEPMITRLVLELSGPVHYRTQISDNKKVLTIETYFGEVGQHLRDRVIFIDPGHGGSDPGAPGHSRLIWEADVVLDISLRLAKILEEQGARVVLSRTINATVDLHHRAVLANRANADIFVSVHADANLNSAIGGTTTYFFAPSTQPHLHEQLADRQRLTRSIQTELVHELRLEDKGSRQANFAVLRGTSMPSVLVETAFMSNPREEQLLADPNFRQQAAEGIARGISAYFQGR